MKKNNSSRRNFLKSAGILAAGTALGGTNTSNLISSGLLFAPQDLIIKPSRLKSGDTVAITSPAGALWDDKTVESFSKILESFGFKIKLGKTLKEKHGYFAGTDDLRAKELNDFFADKEVKGIFCAKGGWGCARLLEKIDYKLIQQNPKVLIGFSDITTLLVGIFAKTGLVTFHGPVGNSGWNDFTTANFKNVLMKCETFCFPQGPKGDDKIITLNKGTAKGILIGGNLSVIAGIMGSNYLPDWKNKILFLEEAKEEPYRIDRMLTQLKLCGVLDNIKGFIFGKCVKCQAEEPQKAFTFMEVLEQHIKPLGIPAFYGAMSGHIEDKWTLPVGGLVEMDAEKGEINLMESAVL